jgi:SAM-dependent methyltransferase
MLSYSGWNILERSTEGTRTRSYFGIYEVSNRPDGSARVLMHGTTLHGIQNLKPGNELVPTSYYAARSGVGLTLGNAERLFGARPRIGVVGLGSGTLSCYARPNQSWTFFEIDPAMERVARERFSFLGRCAPQARIVFGDARLSLRDRVPANSLDVLAVDAFSSDAVPMHLLTREALQVYGRAVRPGGIVLFHISNRYLDLQPVVADLATRGGWNAAMLEYVPTRDEAEMNATVSVWIALTRDPMTLDRLIALSGADGTWLELDPRPGFSGWSDDHASILPIINYPSLSDLW